MPTLIPPPAAVALLSSVLDSLRNVPSYLAAIGGLGFLIFIHELGHFLACRLTKTRVETFSIGFGRRLFGWETVGGRRRFTTGPRRSLPTDGTDVRIALIPLGGYVKMAGEIGGDGSATSGAGAVAREPAPDEYPAKSFGARTLIISAGVIMNAITAFVFFWIAYGTGLEEIPPTIGHVTPGGPAWRAGLEPGDRVVSIDGRAARTFLDLQSGIALVAKAGRADLRVARDGIERTIHLTPDYDEARGLQQAQLVPPEALTLDDGSPDKLVIGALEKAIVAGRTVRGGAEFLGVVLDAVSLGRDSIDVMLPERTPPLTRTVSLARMRKAPAEPRSFKLGVEFFDRRRVAAVRPGSAAALAGLQPDDVIVRVDGSTVSSGAELAFRSSLGAIEVQRTSGPTTLEAKVSGFAGVDDFLSGVAFSTKPPTDAVRVYPRGGDFPDRKSPAADAGVLAGDTLLEVGGKAVQSVEDVTALGATFDGSPVKIKVRTGDEPARELTIAPRPAADAAEREAFLSASVQRSRVDVGGWSGAASVAFDRTTTEIGNIFRLIGRFFGGGVSFQKNISGPLTIASLSSQSVAGGWGTFLALLAFISVNLCVLNFLPIPVLDGGQMLFLLIEKARGGRRLSDGAIAKFQLVGFVLLMALMVFALKNDVMHVFGSDR